MRCAYCNEECEDTPYGNEDYETYDVSIRNTDVTIALHDRCLPLVLSSWLWESIAHPCAPAVSDRTYVPTWCAELSDEQTKIIERWKNDNKE